MYQSVAITVLASNIDADLTGYTCRILRALLPDEMCSPTDANRAKSDGGDIRAYSDSGLTNELAVQVTKWAYDSTDGAGDGVCILDVLVPSVSSSVDTPIYLTYADAAATMPASGSTYGSQAVWANADLISHDGGLTDSSGNHTPAVTGSPPTVSTAGVLGDAINLDGVNDYIGLGDAGKVGVSEDFTIQLRFIYQGAGGASYRTLISRRNGSNWNWMVRHQVSPANFQILIGGASYSASTDTTDPSGWQDRAIVIDGTTARFYLAGATDGTGGSIASRVDPASLTTYLSRTMGTGLEGDFDFDEVRIWKTALPAAWIKADYISWNNPASFATTGTPQTVGGGGITGTGAFVAPVAEVAGQGAVQVSGSGALAAPAAQFSGLGVTGSGAVGVFVAPAAEINGTGTVSVEGQGALAAPPAELDGAGSVLVQGQGALVAPAATVSGVGAVIDVSNDFRLLFENALDLGEDSSGQGNDWTVEGGVSQTLSTPSNRFATLDPLNKQNTVILTEGALEATYASSGNTGSCLASMPFPKGGKWYYEHQCVAVGSLDFYVGVMPLTAIAPTGNHFTFGADVGEILYRYTGAKHVAGAATAYGAAYTTGAVIGVVVDTDNNTVEFYKDGVSQGVITSAFSLEGYVAYSMTYGGGRSRFNFGQAAFLNSLPADCKTLCTANVIAPPLTQGRDVFDANVRDGDGNANVTVTGIPFQPGMVWTKQKDISQSHAVTDSVRGAGNLLFTDSVVVESVATTYGQVTSLNSDGFTASKGTDPASFFNKSGGSYVDWLFQLESPIVNNDGSIQSQVAISAAGHHAIAGYSGNATAGATLGHGLNGEPEAWFIKARNNTTGWFAGFASQGGNKRLLLDTSGAIVTDGNYLNGVLPSSQLLTLGPSGYGTNNSAVDYIAQLFRSVPGVCKVGAYEGVGAALRVVTGFQPRFLIIKRTDAAASWVILDLARDPFNEAGLYLLADLPDAENVASTLKADLLHDGFTLRGNGGAINASGGDYVFIAIADVVGGGTLPPLLGR